MAVTLHPSLAVHPGDWLKSEIVEPHGVSINRLAAAFHVTRQTLSNLFNGHTALSADMAIRFEKAFGVRADTLMRMQTAYALAQARARADDIVVDRVFIDAGDARGASTSTPVGGMVIGVAIGPPLRRATFAMRCRVERVAVDAVHRDGTGAGTGIGWGGRNVLWPMSTPRWRARSPTLPGDGGKEPDAYRLT